MIPPVFEVNVNVTMRFSNFAPRRPRSEEHTSELQSRQYLVCRLLLEKKKKNVSHRSIGIKTCIHNMITRSYMLDQSLLARIVYSYTQRIIYRAPHVKYSLEVDYNGTP